MPDYLRNFVPGGSFFFTVVVHQRRHILTEPPGIDCLRKAFRVVNNKYPFEIDAIILPDLQRGQARFGAMPQGLAAFLVSPVCRERNIRFGLGMRFKRRIAF